jgi:hypothetical protein
MVFDYGVILVVVLIGALIFSAARWAPVEQRQEGESEEKNE